MKKVLLIAAGCLLSLSVVSAASDRFRITAEELPKEYNGVVFEENTVYLVHRESNEKLDSAVIKNGSFFIEGSVDKPQWAYLNLGNNLMAALILEPGEISLNSDGTIIGGTLNQVYEDYQAAHLSFLEKSRNASDDDERQRLLEESAAYRDSILSNNADNPVGKEIFIKKILFLPTVEAVYAELEKYPQMRFLSDVQKIICEKEYVKLFSAGHKFTDFTITNESGSQSLSDYVGKGKPVLVDFWASWCGPCIRETAVLKELLAEYGDKGLEVLGVAVWDKPEDTLAAIEQHQLPWQQIINAQTIPTDLYGIAGIPCIMLIAPDGTIVSRDLQDNALRQSVKALMDSLETPQ